MLKNIGAVGNSPINELMLAWFDHFLKGRANGVSGQPRVDYFLMGANKWKSATSWPLPQTVWTRYYLSGGGGLPDRSGVLTTSLGAERSHPTSTRMTRLIRRRAWVVIHVAGR